ncbi:MAG: hypothetical protein IPH62_00360 [Ignavibacteriae bacterium]|nr:hypothetical protein [Ignavibacteriota bacterium]
MEYPIYEFTNSTLTLNGNWEIEFIKGGSIIPKSFTTKELKTWTSISEEHKWFSGTAEYKTTFENPAFNTDYCELNLGKVLESAEVYLNDEKISTLVGPLFKVNIDCTKYKKNNKLEILVTNLMANRIIDLERKGKNYKKFYNINFAAKESKNLDKNGVFTAKN